MDLKHLISHFRASNSPEIAEEIISLWGGGQPTDDMVKLILESRQYPGQMRRPWDDHYTIIVNAILDAGYPLANLLSIQKEVEKNDKDDKKGSLILYLNRFKDKQEEMKAFAEYLSQIETPSLPSYPLIEFFYQKLPKATQAPEIEQFAELFNQLKLESGVSDYLHYAIQRDSTLPDEMVSQEQKKTASIFASFLKEVPGPKVSNTLALRKIINNNELTNETLLGYFRSGVLGVPVLLMLKRREQIDAINFVRKKLETGEIPADADVLQFLMPDLEKHFFENYDDNTFTTLIKFSALKHTISSRSDTKPLVLQLYENVNSFQSRSKSEPFFQRLLGDENYPGLNTVYTSNFFGLEVAQQSLLSYLIKEKSQYKPWVDDSIKRLLARSDIDVNVPNHKPLIHALEKKDKELILRLLEKGAKIPASFSEADLSYLLSILNEEKKPVDRKVFIQIQAYLYKEFTSRIPQMVFLTEQKNQDEAKTNKQDSSAEEGKVIYDVIYNNDGYDLNNEYNQSLFPDIKIRKGAPLTFNDIPIGYNIRIPHGNDETKKIMVWIYGGNEAKDRQKSAFKFSSSQLSPFSKPFVEKNIVTILLNLPDLLELNVHQFQMPEELFRKIQACVNYFYSVIKDKPELIDNRLSILKDKPVFLTGGSFGGLMTVRHAELYPKTFDGYISHAGMLSSQKNSEVDIQYRGGDLAIYLNPAEDNEIKKITEPVLLLHNMDDNNVIVSVALDFYKKFRQNNNAELATLVTTPTGDPAVLNSHVNKGHGKPSNPKHFERYIHSMTKFMEQGASQVPGLSRLREYLGKKKANTFVKNSTITRKFLGEALELNKRCKHRFIDVRKYWELDYKPLYATLYYSASLSRYKSLLQTERLRLQDKMTDEHISKLLALQSEIFFEYINEISSRNLMPDSLSDREEFSKNPAVIEAFKEIFSELDQAKESTVFYILSNLYKANPDLLTPVIQQLDKDPIFCENLEKAQEKFIHTLEKKKSLTFTIWKQAAEKVSPKESEEQVIEQNKSQP
ncbi:alpha/beta hydrolase family protein [Legionella quinlivanii]|uniref:alpha/beta hydrolase family protein n=1 Tax=Legionella quinlivanii TaxID=45073 RepID=UPI0022443F58|nr:prolyl oligopeptidase family serine peptidase [Legionella quinlivanii]MCW8451486.1 prolyl oligopeptidase family serine peptidase [Legionella quinlivanii]